MAQQEPAKEVVEQEPAKKTIKEGLPLEEVNIEEQAKLLAEFDKNVTEKAPSKEVATGEQ